MDIIIDIFNHKRVMVVSEVHTEQCIICGNAGMEGISICSKFICIPCELEMVNTDVKDEKYPYFIHQMKQLWYQKSS